MRVTWFSSFILLVFDFLISTSFMSWFRTSVTDFYFIIALDTFWFLLKPNFYILPSFIIAKHGNHFCSTIYILLNCSITEKSLRK
jgi:hypothetical protein